MKNTCLLFLLLLPLTFIFPSCKKNNNTDGNVDELSKLPAPTQIGANTFGALVNGKAFTPYSDALSGGHTYQCNYIYINGAYYLTISGSQDPYPFNNIKGINLSTTGLSIYEGATLKLENYNEAGKAAGLYYLINSQSTDYTTTTTIVTGQMHITKLDQVKQIVSGTFSFNAVSSTARDTVIVTNGRFDMQYTR